MNRFSNLVFVLSTIGFMKIGFVPVFSFLFLCWALRHLAFNPRYLTPIEISAVGFVLVCVVSFVNSFFVFRNLGLSFDISYMLHSLVSTSIIAVPFLLLFCKFNFNLQHFFQSICYACGVLASLVLVVGLEHIISFDFISLRHLDTYLFDGWPTRVAPIFAIPLFYALYSLSGNRRVVLNLMVIVVFLLIIFISGTRGVIVPVLLVSVLYFFLSSTSIAYKSIISLLFAAILGNTLVYLLEGIRFNEIVNVFSNLSSLDVQLIFNVESSLGYRFLQIWPFIIENVSEFSPVLGFGGLGPSYLPHSMYTDYPYITPLMASSESQYFDTIFRYGYGGLLVYLIFWFLLGSRVWSLYSNATEFMHRRLLFSFMGFYITLVFQSLTTETLRFLPLSIIFFISLNLITNGHKQR